MKQIALLSDTHHTLDERFYPHFQQADEIWHAGDIGDLSIIDKLESFAPVKAVFGNIDNKIIRSEFKAVECFQCEKIKVIMTHIGGSSLKYNKKIIALIKNKNPDLFICGHSHILKVMYDKKNKFLHMNPGAIGDYGIHKAKTMLSFIIKENKIHDLKIIEFPRNRV